MPHDERTVIDIHGKLIGASSAHTISAYNSDAWLRDIRGVWLSAFSISGNAGALPEVIFMTLSLSNTDLYISATTGAITQTYKETKVPLYRLSNGYRNEDQIVAIAESAPISLANARIKLETISATTGLWTEFTDYTQFVAEFKVHVGSVANKVVRA